MKQLFILMLLRRSCYLLGGHRLMYTSAIPCLSNRSGDIFGSRARAYVCFDCRIFQVVALPNDRKFSISISAFRRPEPRHAHLIIQLVGCVGRRCVH
ncbi:hypothetical protein BJ138DRAFT_1159018 [Hygrophoropsis aurantiaca]|uniref:Uncharacterized protein n=1 Tax=Hygrophoropsis aurantiaca TaxID=72124 RepID=A0ACB8A5D9_9AGAM|nr:hypothetical protein BJ138DRAFT_1159018 [Hygrophoropsis aurantiaca]